MNQCRKSKLDRCKVIRRAHRGVTTKLTREIDEMFTLESLTEEHRTRLNVLRLQLETKSTVLAELDKEIFSCCELGEIEGEIEEAESIVAKIIQYKTKIESVLNPNVGITSSLRSSVVEPSTVETTTSGTKPRLPKLILPTFKGDVTRWVTFWDSYKSAIHNNSQLTKIDKFNYLHSLLDGQAAHAIKGLTLTEANYDSAVELLQQRFGKPQQIITAHMDELIKIPNCTCERPHSLRSVYDQITVHTRGLSAMGINSDRYGSLLIPMIMSKLPSEIRLRVARESTDELWKIDELMDVVKKEVEAREASEGSKFNSPPTTNARTPTSGRNVPTASALVAQSHNIQCVYCNGQHYSASCDKVRQVKKRKDVLIKAGRCFNCLKLNHKIRECQSTKTCRNCHRKHHQSICEGLPSRARPVVPNQEKEDSNNATSTVTNTTQSKEERKTVLLQTAQATAVNALNQKETVVRVLFDSGSQRSYITEGLCTKLGLNPIRTEKLHLNTFGDAQFKVTNSKVYRLYLCRSGCSEQTEIVALCFPVICSTLPSVSDISQFNYLSGLELADCCRSSRNLIDVLVGSDFYWRFVSNEIRQEGQGPVAINSKLGWLLSGPLNVFNSGNLTVCNVIVSGDCKDSKSTDTDQLVGLLKKFWEVEAIGITNDSSHTDSQFLSIEFTEGHYEVTLPWKEGHLHFSDHFLLSLNRLRLLHRRLLKDPQLLSEYNHIIQDQLKRGIIEKVPQPDVEPRASQQGSDLIHYLPHHAVIRQESSTTKLRIVYDGSAKSNSNDCSLNDCLQVGPNFIPKLLNILIQFRSHPVALVTDIEKAFQMVGISKLDRDALRFLWVEDPLNSASKIVHLRFTRLVFGLRSSPAVLGAVISHHLEFYKDKYPDLVQLMENCLYVDDLVTGTNDIEHAFDLYKKAKHIMKEAGLNLRKWNSNSQVVLARIREAEDVAKSVGCTSNLKSAVSEEEESYSKSTTGSLNSVSNVKHSKLLGVIWDSHSDRLLFDFHDVIEYANSLPSSKRSILKVTAKLFDLLGLLSPFIIRLKIMFRTLCIDKLDWDENLPNNLLEEWKSILVELGALTNLSVDRCYFNTESTRVKLQLHGFCDASLQAYAAVVYLRTIYTDGNVMVRILTSKTRVSPIKSQTIPRLELLAAVILARLIIVVKESLQTLGDMESYFWTDSSVVLSWISSNRPYKQYVSSRIKEILQHTNQEDWHHCPGSLNPADMPS